MSRRDGFERILAALIDTIRSGVIQLDRRGRIVAANDLARDLLRRGDGLSDQGGSLHARVPADDAALQTLLAGALPGFGSQGAGGSMLVRRGLDEPRLVLHVSPVGEEGAEIDTERVAALVLVVDPGSRTRIDPALVAATLGLTPMESRVAVWLASCAAHLPRLRSGRARDGSGGLHRGDRNGGSLPAQRPGRRDFAARRQARSQASARRLREMNKWRRGRVGGSATPRLRRRGRSRRNGHVRCGPLSALPGGRGIGKGGW